MGIFEKLKDRYNILILGLILMFLVIIFRLATLTIVMGDEYRKLSDTKRVKQISITAPRGNIRDRYGRLLAGTKPGFTVQIMKDEINNNRFNEIALKLIKILEEDGENYIDEFPIILNKIEYKSEKLYLDLDESPEERIVDTLISQNLISKLLDTYYQYEKDDHKFLYLTGREAVLVLENEGIEVPITANLVNNKVVYDYDKNLYVNKWKKQYGISDSLNPKDALLRLMNNNESIIKKIIGNPIARELAFRLLEKHGLANEYRLVKYSYTFDEEYKSIKRELIENEQLESITMDTTAKEDFVNIILEFDTDIEEDIIIKELFNGIYDIKNPQGKEESVIPGKMLFNRLKERNIYLPITVSIDKEKGKIEYSFIDENSRKSFYTRENINKQLNAQDALIYIGKKTGFIKDIITDDNIKNIAQKAMLNYINPKISVSNWEYTPLNNKRNWLNKYNNKTLEKYSAEEVFMYLREKLGIDEKLSCYEARYILLLREQLNKQGYRAYQPITIAHKVKPDTVAKISENNLNLTGVKVAVEPVRYYPMYETAAHILGYLGKISQRHEIEKYIKELGYSPNDIIGKTGVEEKFEEYLNGVDGLRKVEVDALGNTIRILDEKKAIPGDELYLTIDAELQQVTEQALKHALEEIQKGGMFKSKWGNYDYKEVFKNATSGSVVAIDVKTGEVLALANYPAYDPNLFATGISTEDWENLSKESKDPLAPKPLLNIALRTAIQPGSTFKMITALAALENGLDPDKKISTKGYVDIGNQRFGCWIYNKYKSEWANHGPEDLYEAIMDSCNYYFYTLTLDNNLRRTGKDLNTKIDIHDIVNVAEQFGLNDKTGIEIDIPSEKYGGVPDPNDKAKTTKYYLRMFLEESIKNYIREDVTLEDKEIEAVVDEIVSWVDQNNIFTRQQVIDKLNELGLDGLKKNENGIPLADIIKYTYLNHAPWKEGDTLNISIGQGTNSYTPIQMANYIATLANNGKKNKVSVIKKIQSYDGEKVSYKSEREQEKISVDEKNIEIVKKGMLMVTSSPEGTAYSIFKNFPVKVGAKTGTAEVDGVNPVTGEGYDNYAWFVAFAPYEDPQIAVATVVFQGGHGGYAGPIAREVIAHYLGLDDESEEITFENKMVR